MRLVTLSLVLATTMLASAEASEFAQYPAEAPLIGPPAKARLTTPEAKRFGTVLREAAAQPPNFNGHYRVASWGCGSNCLAWAVVDLQTGEPWVAPIVAGSCTGSHEPPGAKAPDWFDIRMNSSLLYLHDCSGENHRRSFDIRHVYVWSDKQLKLLRTERLP